MPRVIFQDPVKRSEYFSLLKRLSDLTWTDISRKIGISRRHLSDCRRGVYSFPEFSANEVKELYNLDLPSDIVIKKDLWHIRKAAKLGGKRRFILYGPPPATRESRRRGGLNSLKTHNLRKTGFLTRKSILVPNNTEKLAELTGALLGDGGLTLRQLKITLNIKTDQEYSLYLKRLIEELFGIKVGLYEAPHRSTVDVVVSSSNIVDFFRNKGLPIGDKLKNGLSIPKWIFRHRKWQQTCLRGVFDTDGCTYIDHHKYKDKIYRHIGLSFTSYSLTLLSQIKVILEKLGYNPTDSTRFRILLRKEREIMRFFKEIKPSNIRHYDKLDEFRVG